MCVILLCFYYFLFKDKRSSDVAYSSWRVVILVRTFGNGPDKRFPMRELHIYIYIVKKVNKIL